MTDKNLQEILSGEDEKVRQMLGDLKRVEAPKDFYFRLKARIAAADAKDLAPRSFPALRIAAPLGLAIIILAAFVAIGLYSVDKNSVPQVAEGDVPMPNANKDKPKEEFAAANSQPENVLLPSVEKEIRTKDSELAADVNRPKKDAPQNNGGSLDKAAKDPNIILPKGFESKGSFPVKDVLEIIGIEASFSGEKWKVRSVMPNSRAERAGVKNADIIEAINEVKLRAETIDINGAFVGNTLTVVRGGKKIEIDLQDQ